MKKPTHKLGAIETKLKSLLEEPIAISYLPISEIRDETKIYLDHLVEPEVLYRPNTIPRLEIIQNLIRIQIKSIKFTLKKGKKDLSGIRNTLIDCIVSSLSSDSVMPHAELMLITNLVTDLEVTTAWEIPSEIIPYLEKIIQNLEVQKSTDSILF